MDGKNPHRLSIAVDMDGVLADTETHFIQYYEAESGEKVNRKTLLGVPESQAFKTKQLCNVTCIRQDFSGPFP